MNTKHNLLQSINDNINNDDTKNIFIFIDSMYNDYYDTEKKTDSKNIQSHSSNVSPASQPSQTSQPTPPPHINSTSIDINNSNRTNTRLSPIHLNSYITPIPPPDYPTFSNTLLPHPTIIQPLPIQRISSNTHIPIQRGYTIRTPISRSPIHSSRYGLSNFPLPPLPPPPPLTSHPPGIFNEPEKEPENEPEKEPEKEPEYNHIEEDEEYLHNTHVFNTRSNELRDQYHHNINTSMEQINTVIDSILDSLRLPEIEIEIQDDTLHPTTTSGRFPIQAITDTLSNSLRNINRRNTNTITAINEKSKLVSIQDTNSSQYIEDECSICNQPYQIGDIIREFDNCPHYFHYNCIDTWLNTHKNCPICTVDII